MTEKEAVLMYESGSMVIDVAIEFGTSYSTMYRILKKHGALRGKKASMQLSGKEGRASKNGTYRKDFKMPESAKKKISEAKKGKGRGWRITSTGYKEYTFGENAGRLEHVVVMEGIIGRRLYSFECVHHKNHIKTDNRPENLELMSKSEHSRLHRLEDDHLRKRDEIGRYV
jgi:hypothetical protein